MAGWSGESRCCGHGPRFRALCLQPRAAAPPVWARLGTQISDRAPPGRDLRSQIARAHLLLVLPEHHRLAVQITSDLRHVEQPHAADLEAPPLERPPPALVVLNAAAVRGLLQQRVALLGRGLKRAGPGPRGEGRVAGGRQRGTRPAAAASGAPGVGARGRGRAVRMGWPAAGGEGSAGGRRSLVTPPRRRSKHARRRTSCTVSSALTRDGCPTSSSHVPSNSRSAARLAYTNSGSVTPSSNLLCARHTNGALYIASARCCRSTVMRYLWGRRR